MLLLQTGINGKTESVGCSSMLPLFVDSITKHNPRLLQKNYSYYTGIDRRIESRESLALFPCTFFQGINTKAVNMEKISYERLHELLNYEPKTGAFTWKRHKRRCSFEAGDIAGSVNANGYLMIQIDCKGYRANRLAWFYMEGYWPEYEVDHKNRVKTDNRWRNLREVTRSCNMKNCGVSIRNKSGVVGVGCDKASNKYKSGIRVYGKIKHLGYFNELEDAVKARWKAEVKYEYPNCNSSSSAYLWLKERNLIRS